MLSLLLILLITLMPRCFRLFVNFLLIDVWKGATMNVLSEGEVVVGLGVVDGEGGEGQAGGG